jgi:hypothetical protein
MVSGARWSCSTFVPVQDFSSDPALSEKRAGSMERIENEVEVTTVAQKKFTVAGNSPSAGGYNESRQHCAYNQTRECFLGLEVTVADCSYADAKERIATLTLKSGEGLWMLPFSGLPESGMQAPLDLIYLDKDCRVIDAIESFPVFHADTPHRKPASVLALPTHSIYSSQTQPGDQLVICVAEEMEGRLERFSSTLSNNAVKSVALLRERPLWSGGPGLLQLEDRSNDELPGSQKIHEIGLIEPGTKDSRPPKNWLQRWWSPDPRKAPRESSPGLAAYYWNGAPPKAHNIRDISSTGLYLVTEERWYPGTLVLMTLQRTDDGDESTERTISVHSRAVRWGADGVGLQFVLSKAHNPPPGVNLKANGAADEKELEKFLQALKKNKK